MSLDFDLEKATLSNILRRYMGILSLVAPDIPTPAYSTKDVEILREEVRSRVNAGTLHLRMIAHKMKRFLPARNRETDRPLVLIVAPTNAEYWDVITGQRLPESTIQGFERRTYTELFSHAQQGESSHERHDRLNKIGEQQQGLARLVRDYRNGKRDALRKTLANEHVHLEGWFPLKYSPEQDRLWAILARSKRGERGIRKMARRAVMYEYEFQELKRLSRHWRESVKVPTLNEFVEKLDRETELTDWFGIRFVAPTKASAYEVFRYLCDNLERWGYEFMKGAPKNGERILDYYQNPNKMCNVLKLRIKPIQHPDYLEIAVTDIASLVWDELGPHAHHLYEKRQEREFAALPADPYRRNGETFIVRGLELIQGLEHVPLFPNDRKAA
ncbi:TPA: hypothetical protein HA249_03875 [Candidatus Woesearchaeota archaeon]|nr:hypothetical protein [Candidatus Woesearchaeota archaeon]HIH47319.1 hypothetical protein [Candidatus Woesearchaeota archaeon]HII89169.1 hypothetical protein [Candidatus Woesearchaeota archaeon]